MGDVTIPFFLSVLGPGVDSDVQKSRVCRRLGDVFQVEGKMHCGRTEGRTDALSLNVVRLCR